MLWGSFSFSGVSSLMLNEGMMNFYKYINVIERKAIPDMRRVHFLIEENCNRVLPRVFHLKK